MAVSVVFATKEVAEEDKTLPPISERESSGIKSYIQLNVLQRNATWDHMAKDDPRQLALDWILHKDKMQLERLDERLSQRYICALLAFSFDSPAWTFCGNRTIPGNAEEEYDVSSCLVTDQSGQENYHSVWLSNTDECDWYGVTCVDDTVIGLELSEFLPPIFFFIACPFYLILIMLLFLDLFPDNNSLIGEIPSEISKLNLTLCK